MNAKRRRGRGGSWRREQQRQQLEEDLCGIVSAARDDELALFGDVEVARDEWLATSEFVAFVEVHVGDRGQEELIQTHNIFGNHRNVFSKLQVLDGRIAFVVEEIDDELTGTLRAVIAGSEEQARDVRESRARQVKTHQAFAQNFETRFPPLPGQ